MNMMMMMINCFHLYINYFNIVLFVVKENDNYISLD